MKKAKLASKAAEQYDRFRRVQNFLDNPPIVKPDPYRSERQTRYLKRRAEDHVDRKIDELFELEDSTQAFYEKHHGELYKLAVKEMEADGIPFREENPIVQN